MSVLNQICVAMVAVVAAGTFARWFTEWLFGPEDKGDGWSA